MIPVYDWLFSDSNKNIEMQEKYKYYRREGFKLVGWGFGSFFILIFITIIYNLLGVI